MFDNKIIVPDSLERRADVGGKEGFALQARLPYYRGLGLSMVEDIAVTVNGEKMQREAFVSPCAGGAGRWTRWRPSTAIAGTSVRKPGSWSRSRVGSPTARTK